MLNKVIVRKKASVLRNNLFLELGKDCIESKRFLDFLSLIKTKLNLKSIAIYYPIKTEISPLKLVSISRKLGLTVSLPVMFKGVKSLSFKVWSGDQKLKKSYYGTLEPSHENEFIIPEIMIVPLLAFDKNLNRLGYGKGYYDTTINDIRNKGRLSLIVGLGYDNQEFEKIPIEKHDQKMDVIMTEKKIIYKNENLFS